VLKIRTPVGGTAKDQNRNLAFSEILLIQNLLVTGYQHREAGGFRCIE
jgi:hypothetical protein